MKQETKVVIVTGASGGIGAAIVKKFYDNGYSVAMFDINEAALKAVAADLGLDEARAAIQPVDITAEEQVIAAIAAVKERFGKIDALINVAAIIGEYGLTCDCTLENFKNIYNVNVFGTFAMMKHTLPIMLEQKHGNIVNFGSVSGMSGYTSVSYTHLDLQLPEGTEMCMPGDNVTMTISLITPIAIEEGLRFAIREGGRTVGSGVVTEIIE